MLKSTTASLKPAEVEKKWIVIDAENAVVGRLASFIAMRLRGKHRPDYTPHVDCGDFVVVVNAGKVGLTGRKAEQKMKQRYTRYPGGLKEESYGRLRERRPERLVEDAVKRMLPKNRLGRHMLTKLKVYPGTEHPHQSQQPVKMEI